MGKPAASRVRVLMVDDNEQFLMSAGRYLRGRPSCELVGTATSGEEAMVRVPSLRPDLVLVDIAMSGMSGIQLAQALKALSAAPRVVILTMYDDAAHRAAAEAAGADGFLGKEDFGENLLPLVAAMFGPLAERPHRAASPFRRSRSDKR